MKRNDDLLRLAFGELSDDAARVVEASVSAGEKAEVEAFRALRDGLRHLPPPPADNLSSERLRAAILDGELKTRPGRPGLSWTWAPFAIAALGAALFVARPQTSHGSPIVAINDSGSRAKSPDYAPLKGIDAQKLVAPVESYVSKSISGTPHDRVVSFPRSKVRRTRENIPVVVSRKPFGPEAPAPVGLTGPRLATVSSQAVASPPSAVVPATFEALPPTTSEDTIVMVSSGRDKNTGALAATEVEAANVVVGG